MRTLSTPIRLHLAQALFFVMGVSAGLVRAQPATAPAEAAAANLQSQVEALLESGPIEIHGAPVAYPGLIYQFYSQRGFRAAWTDPRTSSELRRALKDSEADGLDPRDYHLPILEQLADGSAPAAAEILQTDALLRIGDHLGYGKVDPATFDAQWNYGRKPDSVDIPQ